jgi:hypothetical protein
MRGTVRRHRHTGLRGPLKRPQTEDEPRIERTVSIARIADPQFAEAGWLSDCDGRSGGCSQCAIYVQQHTFGVLNDREVCPDGGRCTSHADNADTPFGYGPTQTVTDDTGRERNRESKSVMDTVSECHECSRAAVVCPDDRTAIVPAKPHLEGESGGCTERARFQRLLIYGHSRQCGLVGSHRLQCRGCRVPRDGGRGVGHIHRATAIHFGRQQ